MATVFTVDGVTKLIYTVLERDYGVPSPTGSGGGSLGVTGGGSGGLTQAQVQTIVDAAIAAIPAGATDEAAVTAIIEQKLTEFAPMIQQAVQSQFKAMPESIRLNVSDPKDTATIEVVNLSGPAKIGNLNLDLQKDGKFTVNGKELATADSFQEFNVAVAEQLGQWADKFASDFEAEYAKWQAQFALKADKSELLEVSDYVGTLEQNAYNHTQELGSQIVEWAIGEFAKKVDAEGLEEAFRAITDQQIEEKIPGLTEAIGTYLANVLGIYIPKDGESRTLSDATILEIKHLMTGGREIPDDVDWVACPYAGSGTGTLEARMINGTVQFRGALKVGAQSAGTFNTVRQLNAKLPKPPLELNTTAYAVDTGVQYRIAAVRVGTDGNIGISAPTGKYDLIQFDGISYQVF